MPSLVDTSNGVCGRCRAPFLAPQDAPLCRSCTRIVTPLSPVELDELARVAEVGDAAGCFERLDPEKVARLVDAARRAPPVAQDAMTIEVNRLAEAIMVIAKAASEPSYAITAVCVAAASLAKGHGVDPKLFIRNIERMLGRVS